MTFQRSSPCWGYWNIHTENSDSGKKTNNKTKASLKQTPLEIDQKSVITKDNIMVEIDEAIKYHVTVVKEFVYDNENSVVSINQDCQSNLRRITGKMNLNEVWLSSLKKFERKSVSCLEIRKLLMGDVR
ncbi:hypothetical protein IGI67_000021 [Enterococcus sp. AZ196]